MRIKIAALTSVLCLLVTASVVMAQETGESPDSNQQDVVTTPVEGSLRLGNVRKAQVNDTAEAKISHREEIQKKRMESLNAAETKRNEFKQQLAGIRDNQKTATVQRLDTRFVSINNLITDRWVTALETMSGMVDRASSEAAGLEESGVNTNLLDAAVTRAQTAITTAQTSVTTQAGKVYVINITTEAGLRANVGATVSQFRTDIRNTHSSVVAAKQAVMQVVRALATAKLSGTTPSPKATESAVISE